MLADIRARAARLRRCKYHGLRGGRPWWGEGAHRPRQAALGMIPSWARGKHRAASEQVTWKLQRQEDGS